MPFSPTQEWYFNPERLQQSLAMNNINPIGMGSGRMPPMPTSMPQMNAQNSPPAEEQNPIFRGLNAGMDAGRQSLQMDDRQRDAAMGLVIAKMFGGMGSPNSQSILGGLNEGLASGIDAYSARENQVAKLNQLEMERQDALARELQRQKEREQDRNELRQHRNQMLNLKKQEFDIKYGKNGEATINGVDLNNLPELDKSTRSKYSQDYRGTGKLLEELGTIKEKIKELKDTENEGGSPLVSQANPYIGGVANPIKDTLGRGLSGKLGDQLNRERLARKSLNSRLQSFRVRAEREMKGGVLSQGILDRFEKMGTFPDLSQGYDTVETLLSDLEKEASNIHKAAGASLKTGKQITPYELESLMPSHENTASVDERVKRALDAGFKQEEIDAIMQEQ